MAFTSPSNRAHGPKRALLILIALVLAACGGGTRGTSSASGTSGTQGTSSASGTETSSGSDADATSSTAAHTVVVRARTTLAAGVGATMVVRANGAALGTVTLTNVDALQDYAFTTTAAVTRVDVVYTNDALIGSEDRNLVVDSITVDGTRYDAGTATLDRGDGDAAFDGLDTLPGQAWVAWNGALRFTLPTSTGKHTLVVRALTTRAAGVGATMVVRANGAALGTVALTNVDAFQDYVFTTAAAVTNVDVAFTNDAVLGDEDRNLVVDAIIVDGTWYPAAAATLDLGDGAAAFDGLDTLPGQAWVAWNGALRFALDGSSLSNDSSAGGSSSGTSSSTPSTPSYSPFDDVDGFYVDPNSHWAKWVPANPTDWRMPVIRDAIVSKPSSIWFTGDWEMDNVQGNVWTVVQAARDLKKLPSLVLYNIPHRACGTVNSGGAASVAAYQSWVEAVSKGAGWYPAVVIVEPDALMQSDECLTGSDTTDRWAMLKYAAAQFKANAPLTFTYLDAGNPGWKTAEQVGALLMKSGIEDAHGFAINVSNYYTTAESTAYGQAINAWMVANGGKAYPFLVDTSRNGKGRTSTSSLAWCNPAGAQIGATAQVVQAGGQPEVLDWVGSPGVRDDCNPPAGFDADIAYKLALGL